MTDGRAPTGPATRAAHSGYDPSSHAGAVNPPVYHTSTVVFPTVEALERGDTHPFDHMRYGRIGTPTSAAFEQAVASLEGAAGSVVASSGLAACTSTLLSFVKAGDHLLLADCVYGPTRNFAQRILSGLGVEVEVFAPELGAGVAHLFRKNTRAVFMESPGSWTFDVMDVPAIAEVARKSGVLTMIDNTWATPFCMRPIAIGVDLSIHAATKYIVGHSDAMLGVTSAATPDLWTQLKSGHVALGQSAGPDDIYLGLRGLRTLPVRLAQHAKTGLALAEWLAGRPEVKRVLHPALPDDPGHALWRRDFAGCSGLFAIELKSTSRAAITAMVEGMRIFKMGWSWGGFESLIVPGFHRPPRSQRRWDDGTLVRIHAGLEDFQDLKSDLVDGFARLATVGG